MITIRSIPPKLHVSVVALTCLVLVSPSAFLGQNDVKSSPKKMAGQNVIGDEISGMYTFLREGEFVQITVENGQLSGFVSRFGDRDSDRNAFLDQFFNKASLDGKKISFTTKPVHGTWFEFSGQVSRGEAKTPDKEGYWTIRGELTQFDEDESKNVSSKSREVKFKSFPQDVNADAEPK